MKSTINLFKNKNLIYFFIVIISILTLSLIVGILFPKTTDEKLLESAKEISDKCPMTYNKKIMLEKISLSPTKEIVYNYKFINKAEAEIEMDSVRKYVVDELITLTKTNPDLKIFRENKKTINYILRDKNGEFLFTISVPETSYRN